MLASAYNIDMFGYINRDTMWEGHNRHRYDESDDLEADLDGFGNVIPNTWVSTHITGQHDEEH